jgi:hypothetical protein
MNFLRYIKIDPTCSKRFHFMKDLYTVAAISQIFGIFHLVMLSVCTHTYSTYRYIYFTDKTDKGAAKELTYSRLHTAKITILHLIHKPQGN